MMDQNSIKQPLVSICIPTYNSERYLDKMLQSIVSQTYKNLEVIISDNHSTDNTYGILKTYSLKYNWHINQNEKNIGALENMNKLLKSANGEYVALYHADDLYDPEIVAKSVEVLNNKQEVSMVSTMGYSIDASDNILSQFKLPKSFTEGTSITFQEVFHEILSQRPFFIITPSVMTRSSYYKLNHKLNSKYNSAADYGLWFEILQEGNLYIHSDALIRYRTHDNQGSQKEIKENYEIPDSVVLYEDYANTDKELYWKQFLYSYFKLMLIQAFKLNNIGIFDKSQMFLKMITKRSSKYIFPWIVVLSLFNLLHLRFSLSRLLSLKKMISR